MSDLVGNPEDRFSHVAAHLSSRYPTSIASLAFSNDGSALAIASSYMYENDEIKNIPEDHIYIRNVSDQETKPK